MKEQLLFRNFKSNGKGRKVFVLTYFCPFHRAQVMQGRSNLDIFPKFLKYRLARIRKQSPDRNQQIASIRQQSLHIQYQIPNIQQQVPYGTCSISYQLTNIEHSVIARHLKNLADRETCPSQVKEDLCFLLLPWVCPHESNFHMFTVL